MSDEKYFVRNVREGDDLRANCFIIFSSDPIRGRAGESFESRKNFEHKFVRENGSGSRKSDSEII
jgi:hypothetical protein